MSGTNAIEDHRSTRNVGTASFGWSTDGAVSSLFVVVLSCTAGVGVSQIPDIPCLSTLISLFQNRTYGLRNQGRSHGAKGKKPGANIHGINRLGDASCPAVGG
jgi:hypothetical protein